MNEYYVYIYCDPVTLMPFYVGKGKDDRIKSSCRSSYGNYKKKLDELADLGHAPISFKYAENLTEDEALDIESYLIYYLSR